MHGSESCEEPVCGRGDIRKDILLYERGISPGCCSKCVRINNGFMFCSFGRNVLENVYVDVLIVISMCPRKSV